MITSYIIYTLILYSLHLSLWPAALVTFNEEDLQLPLFLAATPFSWMLHVSRVMVVHSACYTSFELSILFTLELRIKSSIASALGRQWSFAGVPFFVRLQIRVSLSFLSLAKEVWRRDSIPSFVRKNVQKSYILPQDHGVLASSPKFNLTPNPLSKETALPFV